MATAVGGLRFSGEDKSSGFNNFSKVVGSPSRYKGDRRGRPVLVDRPTLKNLFQRMEGKSCRGFFWPINGFTPNYIQRRKFFFRTKDEDIVHRNLMLARDGLLQPPRTSGEKERRARVKNGVGSEEDLPFLENQIRLETERREKAKVNAWKYKPSFASLLKPAPVSEDPIIQDLAYIKLMENRGTMGALLVENQLEKIKRKYKGTIVVRKLSVEKIEGNYAAQFVKVNWGIPDDQFHIQVRNYRVFLIIFNRTEDYEKVKNARDTWMRGVYTIVRGWKEGKGSARERIETLPIWVTLPKFPVHLWDTTIFSSIGSVLGVPIRVDAHTAKAPNSETARILVKREAFGDFPKEVPIFIK
ncbi:hypothetical protein ZOSMA_203G00080 [Zostera marina]|uniref:Uncharacterized protein n=1 Tax=Zostera marina TaxID=29655 RepID=A0A0K9PLN0_ZOSMR|nr:hypothetical protein ZOSMA_203G00080 [Zostera marina]